MSRPTLPSAVPWDWLGGRAVVQVACKAYRVAAWQTRDHEGHLSAQEEREAFLELLVEMFGHFLAAHAASECAAWSDTGAPELAADFLAELPDGWLPCRHSRELQLPVARRAGKPTVRRVAASDWRRPGQSPAVGLVNSVFALGAVTPGRRSYTDLAAVAVTPSCEVTPVQGSGAERREGGGAHLLADGSESMTWRAPWGPGYALHRPKSTS